MAEQNEQAAPAVEDALPQIYMSREKLLFTFPGGEPFEIKLQEALSTGHGKDTYIIALLWFMNVQLHTLVTMMQQASAQSQNPEALSAAALKQVRAMIPGLDDLIASTPGGAQAVIQRFLSGEGKG